MHLVTSYHFVPIVDGLVFRECNDVFLDFRGSQSQ